MPNQVTSDPPTPTTSPDPQLTALVVELRKAVDNQLDALVRSKVTVPSVVQGLARLEGMLDIFSDYSKRWRPADVIEGLHGDLVTFNKDHNPILDRPAVGAYLEKYASKLAASGSSDVFGSRGVRLEGSDADSFGIGRGLS